MIKTKSILENKSESDGTRICIMRYVKDFYDYDEWQRDLAPSLNSLMIPGKTRLAGMNMKQGTEKKWTPKKN